MIRLEPIRPDNWRPGLRVREDQKKFVSDANGILARAYAYRNYRSRAFLICHGETPVGMALYHDCDDCYDLSQFFIDERFQRRGFGLRAARLLLEKMEKDGRFDRVILCYVDGDTAARDMYLKLGFRHTGEADGDEIIMEKFLR